MIKIPYTRIWVKRRPVPDHYLSMTIADFLDEADVREQDLLHIRSVLRCGAQKRLGLPF